MVLTGLVVKNSLWGSPDGRTTACVGGPGEWFRGALQYWDNIMCIVLLFGCI